MIPKVVARLPLLLLQQPCRVVGSVWEHQISGTTQQVQGKQDGWLEEHHTLREEWRPGLSTYYLCWGGGCELASTGESQLVKGHSWMQAGSDILGAPRTSSHYPLGRCQRKATRCKQLLGKCVALQLDHGVGCRCLCQWVLRKYFHVAEGRVSGNSRGSLEQPEKVFSFHHPLVKPLG